MRISWVIILIITWKNTRGQIIQNSYNINPCGVGYRLSNYTLHSIKVTSEHKCAFMCFENGLQCSSFNLIKSLVTDDFICELKWLWWLDSDKCYEEQLEEDPNAQYYLHNIPGKTIFHYIPLFVLQKRVRDSPLWLEISPELLPLYM